MILGFIIRAFRLLILRPGWLSWKPPTMIHYEHKRLNRNLDNVGGFIIWHIEKHYQNTSVNKIVNGNNLGY